MMKIALVGCGMVADQHMAQIRRVPGAEIVGVCDTEPLMARQLADRFHVPNRFSEVSEMLRSVRPDVVHITTPAQTHFPIGKICLDAGCHVYMEKPFAVDARQTEALLGLAESRNLKMTVGHDLQFDPESIRMRELVKGGFLGGPPVHMECMQCYSHDDPTYGKVLLGDRTHWVRSLPGSLLQNLISHGLARIAEFLPAGRPVVFAHAYSSPYLGSIGQNDVIDELRAVIYSGENTTAYFTFSTQLGAANNQLCLYGRKASLVVDSNNRMVVPIRPKGYKSYLRFFLMPLIYAGEHRRNSWHNVQQFLRQDFHMDYGKKVLMQSFYQSIQDSAPPPIPYREIRTTAWMMDDMFAQIRKT
jgi:predicted dehydrogenase